MKILIYIRLLANKLCLINYTQQGRCLSEDNMLGDKIITVRVILMFI